MRYHFCLECQEVFDDLRAEYDNGVEFYICPDCNTEDVIEIDENDYYALENTSFGYQY